MLTLFSDIAQWYMTVATDPDFVMEVFDRQVEIALGMHSTQTCIVRR